MNTARLALATSILALAATGASAGWNEFWHSFHVDYKRNACWPEPFIAPNRASVHRMFAAMTAKGWQRQCTLGAYHFDADTQRLTSGGREQLRWILTQVPPQHRTVFVQRGHDREATIRRLDAVQQATARMLPEGALPGVVATNVPPAGGSAEYYNDVYIKSQQSMPTPRLPELSGDAN